MGYIIKKTEPLVNVKLTDKGREQLSLGQLRFTKFSLSDGEMVYTNDDTQLLNILRPADNQPAAKYMIPSEGTTYVNPITSIVSFPKVVYADAKDRGFFSGATYTDFMFDYMLCGAYSIPQENFTGGTILNVLFASGSTVTGTSINPTGGTPSIGDLMLIKVPKTGFTGTLLPDVVDFYEPVPYLWFQIYGITGDTSTGFRVEVDRTLPNMHLTGTTTGSTGYAYFYVGGDMIHKVFDEENPSAYWSGGLLDFTDTCSNAAHDVPIWNMSVVYVADIVGLDHTVYKGHDYAVGNNYMGIYPYFMYAANTIRQDKVGIIHYTNNTVSNYYGEGFYSTTPELHLPTLMWHKKQFGGAGFGDQIGYTFVCDSTLKYLENLRYYDLIDSEVTPTTVGKVFIDLQIIVIENEELITAMSLKSNRNWSLPKPVLQDMDAGRCTGSGNAGIITSDEELHVTYALIDTVNGITGVHCEDYSTVGTTKSTADVLFRFPNDPEDPTYSEFPYFKKRSDGVGFSADNLWIILQKTTKNSRPLADSWKYFNANAYIGADGCIPITIPNVNNYELFIESKIVSNVATTTYKMTHTPIGDIIVSKNGHVLKEASDVAHIYYDTGCTLCGDYVQIGDQVFFGLSGGTTTDLLIGDVLQFNYLIGTVIAATTVKIDIFVPNTIPASGDIYQVATEVYSDLPSDPDGDVYLFYNGHVLSDSNYSVEPGGAYTYRVHYGFIPPAGSRITILYLNNTGGGGNVTLTDIQPSLLNDVRVTLNDQTFPILAMDTYDLNNVITLPLLNTTGMTFGDETFFYGNVSTKIKATIYKSIINVTVMPNRFIKSTNPTFNENIHKVAFTELDIYDDDGNVVGVGKFSEPLQRRLNSDVMIINAVIDF